MINLFDKHTEDKTEHITWLEYKSGILSNLWRKIKNRNKPPSSTTPFLIRGRIVIKGEPPMKKEASKQSIEDLIK